MSTPNPSLSVKLDVTNPGQFFACCGLLELAHRLWPGAEGWFVQDRFHISAHVAPDTDVLGACLAKLRESTLSADDSRGEKATRPVHVTHADGIKLTLDWWIDRVGNKTELKLWAGQQTSIGIIRTLCSALPEPNNVPLGELFDAGQPLTGRFGVDPRAAWNALDVGFSPNEQQMEVSTYPAVELLAAMDLQGFRPRGAYKGRWRYATWSVPLPPSVARASSAGIVPAGEGHRYLFEIETRGSYKGFDFATPIGDET
jgi:CRISPR-associated protein Csx14